MKTALTMCLLGVLLLAGGCGNERSEKKIDGFLTAMVAARNQRVNLISLDENELKFAREELASMMPQQKSQVQQDLENVLKSRGVKVEEGAVVQRAIVADGVHIGKNAKVGSADSEHIELVAKRVKGEE